jgi:hypothetical protein
MKKQKQKLIWGGVIVVAVGLMIWGSGAQQAGAGTWQDTDVACLAGGHQAAINHLHANLSVVVDGEERPIPSSAGVSAGCMAEVHTHDSSGQIHVETARGSADRSPADFFAVWDEPFERANYERTVTVNGEAVVGESYTFSEGDQVVVRYQNSANATSSANQSTSSSAN